MRVEQSIENLSEHDLVAYLTAHMRTLRTSGTKIISIVGGPGSGKGELTGQLVAALTNCAALSTDSYLIGSRAYRKAVIEATGRDPIEKYNFTFLRQQIDAIRSLRPGESIGVPVYDTAPGVGLNRDPSVAPHHSHFPTKISSLDYLIIEGDFQPLPRDDIDCLIYIDVPGSIRLANRLHRDLRQSREVSQEAVRRSFASRQSQFNTYTLPHKQHADIVLTVTATPLDKRTPTRRFAYTFTVLHNSYAALV